MKPIQLKLTAFGPFAKPTVLNFKDDLANQQIFVISGPTGAGKTTIFDAMCYALYGETSGKAREGKAYRSDFVGPSGDLTEVELTFEVNGKTYVISRRPQQVIAKKSGKGTTKKDAEQSFYEVGKSENILTRSNEILAVIHEIVGLTVDQFRKIVMIPQGDFKEFLLAKTTDKEEILRKIFGTSLFQQLQTTLSEQAKALSLSVGKLNDEMDTLLKTFNGSSEDVQSQLQLDLPREEKIGICEADLVKHQEAVQLKKAEGIALKQEVEQKEQQLAQLNERESKFKELEEIKQVLLTLQEKQSDMMNLKNQLAAAESAIEVNRFEQNLHQKNHAYQMFVQQHEATIQQVKQLNQQFVNINEAYLKLPKEEEEHQSYIKQAQALEVFEKDVNIIANQQQTIKQIEPQWQVAKHTIEMLSQQLVNLRENHQPLDQLYDQLTALKETKNSHDVQIKQCETQLGQVKKIGRVLREVEDVSMLIKTKQEELTHKENEVNILKEKWRIMYEAFIQGAAVNLAAHLKADMPCPVCGSTHHPHIATPSGAMTTKEAVELVKVKVDHAEREILTLKTELATHERTLQTSQEYIVVLIEELGWNQQENLTLVKMLELHQNISEQLVNSKTELEQAVGQENQMLQTITRVKACEKQLNDVTLQLEKAKEDYHHLTNSLEIEQRTLADALNRVPQVYHDVNVLRGVKQELAQKAQALLQKMNQVKQQYEDIMTQKAGAESSLQTESKMLEDKRGEVQIATQQFEQAVTERFNSVERYRQSLIAPTMMQQYVQAIKAYEEQCFAANKHQEELNLKLQDVQRVDLAPYEVALSQCKEQKEMLDRVVAAQETTLKQNERIMAKIQQSYQANQVQLDEYKVIGHLSTLANGRLAGKMTFETYVLCSYFEDVLYFANQRLMKMTNQRYELIRREESSGGGRKGLELDVYDAHTAKSRSVSTLSGGEAFKASLALALGLSDTVIHNAGGISLDTMFIDEGFGTLDSDSLEQAIEILMELQDNGRLIGVISHVEELKQRITAKLVVETSPSGSTAHFVY